MVRTGLARHDRKVTLFSRVVAINAGVLVAAAILLAVSPATVSPTLQLAEAVVLAVGTVLMISVNLLLMRRVFGPLEQLTRLMRTVDPQVPGRRLSLERADTEVAELSDAFNAMLDRLEHERRQSGRRALAAQESERRRLARELHDEIGQTLTGVVLQLEALQRSAPDGLQAAILEAQETARSGVEDMREIARGLRPQALDEFGLRSALVSLSSQVSDRSGVRVHPRLERQASAATARARPRDLPRGTGELDQCHPPCGCPSCRPVAGRDRSRRRRAPCQRRRTRHLGHRRKRGRHRPGGHARACIADRRTRDDLGERAWRHGGQAHAPRRQVGMTVPLCSRLLVADDHRVVRRGLSLVLDAAPDLHVVAEASDGIEAVERTLAEDIDLAILDVAMPRLTGLQAARELSRRTT